MDDKVLCVCVLAPVTEKVWESESTDASEVEEETKKKAAAQKKTNPSVSHHCFILLHYAWEYHSTNPSWKGGSASGKVQRRVVVGRLSLYLPPCFQDKRWAVTKLLYNGKSHILQTAVRLSGEFQSMRNQADFCVFVFHFDLVHFSLFYAFTILHRYGQGILT